MKFFLSTLPDPKTDGIPPTPEMMAAMDKFIAEQKAAGTLLMTGGMLPVSMGGARVNSKGGKFTIMDGPFAETKEVIAGWAIIRANSLEEAIEASRKFYQIVGDGQGEIRQIVDDEDGPGVCAGPPHP